MSDSLTHLSEKPWSEYKASDYSVEQWHQACLIHQHDGVPSSKGQCKLPVKTPNGAINRNGVHAAAAALSGARGGVHASSDSKRRAANILVQLYRKMDEEPPPSLIEHSSFEDLEDFLEHYGVKGMKWGVRRDRRRSRGSSEDDSEDAKKARAASRKIRKSGLSSLSNEEIRVLTNRLQLEKQLSQVAPKGRIKSGYEATRKILEVGSTVNTAIAFSGTPAGKAINDMLKANKRK